MAGAPHAIFLAVAAFCLGACPFSLWVGRRLLGKDIRDYGDGNPGAVNVFRAGGRKAGCFALVLDITKGTPFVILAHSVFGLSEAAVAVVGVSAIAGSAFSPLLRFRGGKSIAITYGVLLALPHLGMCFFFALFMFLGFLFIKSHSWVVMVGPIGSLALLAITGASHWELSLMLSILIILTIKNRNELRTAPKFELRFTHWLPLKRSRL